MDKFFSAVLLVAVVSIISAVIGGFFTWLLWNMNLDISLFLVGNQPVKLAPITFWNAMRIWFLVGIVCSGVSASARSSSSK